MRMDEKEFWEVIDSVKKNNRTDYIGVGKIFDKLSYEKTIDFALHFENILDVLDTSTKAYAFAALLEGSSASDDSWLYFRSWFVYQGKDIVIKSMENPDLLIDIYSKHKTKSKTHKEIFGDWSTEDYLSVWYDCYDEEIMGDIVESTIFGQVTFANDDEIDGAVTESDVYFKKYMPKLWDKFSEYYRF